MEEGGLDFFCSRLWVEPSEEPSIREPSRVFEVGEVDRSAEAKSVGERVPLGGKGSATSRLESPTVKPSVCLLDGCCSGPVVAYVEQAAVVEVLAASLLLLILVESLLAAGRLLGSSPGVCWGWASTDVVNTSCVMIENE